jgi:hypothetical protein
MPGYDWFQSKQATPVQNFGQSRGFGGGGNRGFGGNSYMKQPGNMATAARFHPTARMGQIGGGMEGPPRQALNMPPQMTARPQMPVGRPTGMQPPMQAAQRPGVPPPQMQEAPQATMGLKAPVGARMAAAPQATMGLKAPVGAPPARSGGGAGSLMGQTGGIDRSLADPFARGAGIV